MLYLFGDESGNPGTDPYWGIGYLVTPEPEKIIQQIKEIRRRYNYFKEFKSTNTDYSQVLPAIDLIDMFFNNKNTYFKLIVIDRGIKNTQEYINNLLEIKPEDYQYIEAYKILTKRVSLNFWNKTSKTCYIDNKSHTGRNFLERSIKGYDPDISQFKMIDSKELTRENDFTGNAELVQMSDFLTGIIISLCKQEPTEVALNEPGNKNKKIYRKRFLVRTDEKERAFKRNSEVKKNIYYPNYKKRKIDILYWK